jgi:ABC-2 type transport system permease protein
MSKTLKVLRHEFLSDFRRRGYLIVTFLIPLLLVGGVILWTTLSNQDGDSGTGTEAPTAPDELFGAEDISDQTGVVDESGVFAPPEPGSPFESYLIFYDDEDAARDALDAGTIDAYFIIADDYMESGDVVRYAKQLDVFGGLENESNLLRNFLVLHMLGEEADQQVFQRLADPVNFDITVLEFSPEGQASEAEEPSLGEGAQFILPYAFGFLVFLGTMFASGYLMVSVVKERENRMIEIVLSSIKPFPLLVGKVLASGSLGLVQVIAYLAAMWAIAPRLAGQTLDLIGLDVPPHLIVMGVIYFVVNFFMVGGLFTIIAAMVDRVQDAQQFVGVLVLPAMAPLFVINQIIEAPNGGLAAVLSMFPLTAPMGMMMRLSLVDVPTIQIVISVILTALGALASIWFAARLFRVNTLLAGQRPKLKDLWHLVREEGTS